MTQAISLPSAQVNGSVELTGIDLPTQAYTVVIDLTLIGKDGSIRQCVATIALSKSVKAQFSEACMPFLIGAST